jgi:calcineurin-like phosphoesterase
MEALEAFLPGLIHEHSADACIVNGENAWEGKSLNQSLLQRMRKAGAQVITGGNHTWDRFQIHPLAQGRARPAAAPQLPRGLLGQRCHLRCCCRAGNPWW